MKISEQAVGAARKCDERDPSDYPAIIQTAINDHERDLVEAAESLLAHFNPCTYKAVDAQQRLKAALDRRRE